MWDLLGLQLIGDKVQGGEKGEGIKDGESLEWGGGVDGQHVYPSNDRQADMQKGSGSVMLILSPLLAIKPAVKPWWVDVIKKRQLPMKSG